MSTLMPLLYEVVVGGGVTPLYDITGNIVDENTDPVSGVTVTLTGDASDSATTDGSGDYTLSGHPDGSYTVTPTKTDQTFTPTSRNVTISGSAQTADFAQDEIVFTAVTINFTDMTAESPPDEGGAAPSCESPVVKTNMGDGVANVLAPTIENRTCYVVHGNDPPTAWGWDLRDYGNGLDAPAAGWRMELYYYGAAPYVEDSRQNGLELYIGNSKTTWRTATGGDDDLFINISFQTTKARFRVRSVIDTTITTYRDDDSLTAVNAYGWQRIRIEFDGSARTAQVISKNVSTAVTATGGVASLPNAGTWPFPGWRYVTVAAHINTDTSSFGLQRIWIGNLADDWPTARTIA